MILVIKSNGLWDMEISRKFYQDLTRREVIEYFQVAGYPISELRFMSDNKNAHFFGDTQGTFLYSKMESDSFLMTRRDSRVSK